MKIVLKWLENNGAHLIRVHRRNGRLLRFEPPDGHLTINETAVVLKTNDSKLRRLARSGLLKIVQVHGRPMIPLTEVRRLTKDQEQLRDRRKVAAEA